MNTHDHDLDNIYDDTKEYVIEPQAELWLDILFGSFTIGIVAWFVISVGVPL